MSFHAESSHASLTSQKLVSSLNVSISNSFQFNFFEVAVFMDGFSV
jgi:hypothetical protein